MSPEGQHAVDPAAERLTRLVHDLRTPLTVISGFCELLERQHDKLSEEQKLEYTQRVAAAAAELRTILDSERDERLPTT
ncbi:MAG: histidine kinase dimerization/phospho-acceptor domain-containing protein [Solirubrobacteraceae bacterium]